MADPRDVEAAREWLRSKAYRTHFPNVASLASLLTKAREQERQEMERTIAANLPARVPGSLQEEVDSLRRMVAELQVNKHNLLTRLIETDKAVKQERQACEEIVRDAWSSPNLKQPFYQWLLNQILRRIRERSQPAPASQEGK